MKISVLFNEEQQDVRVTCKHGEITGTSNSASGAHATGLNLEIDNYETGPAAKATVISIVNDSRSFSFFLRDVRANYPIYIPDYGVIVTTGDDGRAYEAIESEILSKHLKSAKERIESTSEWSFDRAAEACRKEEVPTWLGLSRDVRIFEINNDHPEGFRYIYPKYHSQYLPGGEGTGRNYGFWFDYGRGFGCADDEDRRLYDGTLPILTVTKQDNELEYTQTMFVTLESSVLGNETNRGTDALIGDACSAWPGMCEKHQKIVDQIRVSELNRPEETVLYMRLEAVNKGTAPDYAYFIFPRQAIWHESVGHHEIGENGLFTMNGEVFAVGTINGKPITRKELSTILFPGEKVTIDIKIPHKPISEDRAKALISASYDTKLHECVEYWNAKLDSAAKFNVPEIRIKEMIQAGLLHLDLISYGIEPDGPISPCVGVYSCIGTESAPIIMYYDSMGWHKQAERCLEHFLSKQQDDGRILNYGKYMSETGAVLWTIGEHFSFTRDLEWIKGLEAQILKLCNFIIRWREKNKVEEYRGRGYGLIDGQVADPEDPFHIYSLNAHACEAVRRIGEIFQDINPTEAERLQKEAVEFKEDILAAVKDNMANSPVAPLKDGTWCPTIPSWAEQDAPCFMYTTNEPNYSHGTFVAKDSLLGPLSLAITGNIHPADSIADNIIKVCSDLLNYNDAPVSQPYYSPMYYCHLMRGEAKQFIKAFYNTIAALVDRGTYTFWEHFYRISAHKTHEEAWFLMQTRWMHYMEDGNNLRLFSGIPAKWLEEGKIEVSNACSYFGRINFSIQKNDKKIAVRLYLDESRLPSEVHIRIPGDGISIENSSAGEIKHNWIILKTPGPVNDISVTIE